MALGLLEALDQLAALLEGSPYHYETTNVKRSIPDADACELCEECADQEWIEDGEVFESGEDAPPHHPNCKCSIEYGEKRKRVYD